MAQDPTHYQWVSASNTARSRAYKTIKPAHFWPSGLHQVACRRKPSPFVAVLQMKGQQGYGEEPHLYLRIPPVAMVTGIPATTRMLRSPPAVSSTEPNSAEVTGLLPGAWAEGETKNTAHPFTESFFLQRWKAMENSLSRHAYSCRHWKPS